ncbi:molybdopterin-dependent oxidoreductase [Brevibacillus massiliensis]|uniref:molybdopterin-dependent oxidoreductase n=1 Tax=Brevibacillus massiliensis TaxID=1118054 RepID=UPI00037CFE26|nr:molybdopterin-dependent oxidoreductase [Brevibacillus massiliensis]
MKNRRWLAALHGIHAAVLSVLLATGACLYVPALRTMFGESIRQVRSAHIGVGLCYLLLLAIAVVPTVQYLRRDRRWTKTFHVCLQYLLGAGWIATGIYLWGNNTEYLRLRQLASSIHGGLSLFIIPWALGHIALWYVGKIRQRGALRGPHDRGGQLFTRREVLVLFAGGLLALMAGGLLRWFRPLTDSSLASLDTGKRRGYFRIYSMTSEIPPFDPDEWRLTVDGLVEQKRDFTFAELTSLPSHVIVSDFHCSTGWSVTQVKWKGVPFSSLLELVNPEAAGTYVKMYSADRMYTETYELSQLLQQNVLLAYELDDKPLLPQQGAPLRLVHPDMYGYKSIKWLSRIEFTQQRGLGYWEEKEGYDLNGYIA